MLHKLRIATAAALVLSCTLIAPSSMAETTLRLSSWLPPGHPIVRDMIIPWTEQVAEATQGRVKVNVLPKPLGKPPAHFDLAKDGVADVTFGVHGYQPGRFLLTKAVEMPFLGDSAESTSVAYWRVYKQYMEKANEHDGVTLLSVFTHGPGHIFNSKRAVNALEDLNGLKIRVGGGVVNDIAQAIGATALLKPASQAYELMSNGVADGVFFPSESVASFKLTKLVHYGTLVPKGLYNTSFFLVMNSKTFGELPKADQDAIMKVSGENFARLSGKAWDNVDQIGIARMKEDGVTLSTASDALVGQIKKATAGVEQGWVSEANAKGADGAAIMSALRAEIAKIEGK
ncbi:MAG: ABC transporter substrate-binding protein [Proteobacteria bacterium]|nr:MAG: ABC transporter substrate-binding protein [Pseudomonadota bacterium]QKK11753.1 MAG: TRAP transporter substrate-binding protein [Pseudomonadota bacterium]